MDFLFVEFSISGVKTWVFLPPLVAFIVSFFTSIGGVSGAFLLLPFQMSFLGYTSPSVSATNQLFNVVAIPSGVYRYFKEGRMVWPLTWVVVAGTLPGVFIGAILRIACLPDPKRFKLFASGVLLYIALRMVRDLARKVTVGQGSGEQRFRELVRSHQRKAGTKENTGTNVLPAVKVTHFNHRRLGYTFYGEQFDISIWSIFALSFVVGVVGGIYGIGGGAIIAPFFVSFLRLPVYTVAGAALMGTFVTSVAGVGFYQGIAAFYPDMSVAPDWSLGILFGLGGMAGMYLGARCQKYVPARAIKWMLAAIIGFTALKYATDFFGM
ncbi:MAG: sulfite exporter TauE/SafE family protein [Desulfobacteraceae bacterium]|nr:MAG: sulfite exporter TauE/SafE family protein [Desulfobacteraceae bacterium]